MGQPLYSGQESCSQLVLYSEVPLYMAIIQLINNITTHKDEVYNTETLALPKCMLEDNIYCYMYSECDLIGCLY